MEQIYKTYSPMVYRICMRYVRNEFDAEDLVHTVFMKILTKIHSFKEQSQLFTWIYRIAVNECLQFLRKKKSDGCLHNNLLLWNEQQNHHDLDSSIITGLKQILNISDKKTRMILFLIYYEGLTQEEAAEVVGISRRALNKRISLFRTKVGEVL